MNRENFARLCLVVSIAGLGIMYASTEMFQPSEATPSEISKQDVGETYKVAGNVSGFYMTDSAAFFTLKGENGEISVADFDARSLESGEKVEIIGPVDLYQGDVQIVASEIERRP